MSIPFRAIGEIVDIILGIVDAIITLLLFYLLAKGKKAVDDLNAARVQAEAVARKLEKLYGEAVELPATLPKTFPDHIYQMRELPAHLQRAISRDVRDRGKLPENPGKVEE